MLDAKLRPLKNKLFHPLAERLAGTSPAALTWIGFGWGALTAVFLTQQLYLPAFLTWFLNRLFDGLDGMVARRAGRQSDLGGYLDILLDFVVYAAVPIALVVGRPTPVRYLLLALLLAVFYVNAASWIYLSALLEKRRAGAAAQGESTSVTMPQGLIGGSETILFYTAFIFFPGWMGWLFGAMAGLTAVTIWQRWRWAARHLGDSQQATENSQQLTGTRGRMRRDAKEK